METKSKLLDPKNSSFGLRAANDLVVIGTQSHVHAFFLIINDLISSGKLEDQFQTISYDLYRNLIWEENYENFFIELPIFRNALLNFPTNSVDWQNYPISNGLGEFDYQNKTYDTNLENLGLVFDQYLRVMDDYILWVNSYKERNWGHPKMFVSPTSIAAASVFKRQPIEKFISNSKKPLWLQL